MISSSSRTRRMTWASAALSAALAWLLPFPPAHAQPKTRLVYVTVIDNEQRAPLQGLGPDDFFVFENGVQREVLRASRATEPQQLAVLVDTSAAAGQVITDFRAALEGFVDELSAVDEVTLVTFGGPRHVVVAPTSDHERVRTGLSKLFSRPDTATYLLSALEDAARVFRQRAAPRPAVVVVTTNGVDFSDQEPQEVVTRLQQSGAQMHVVITRTASVQMRHQGAFGTAAFPSWASRARDAILDTGPRQTGGQRVEIPARAGTAGVLQQMAQELSNQYAVVYSSQESLLPARQTRVGVHVENVTVRATPSMAPR